jgi:hypothetical protein
VICSFIYLALVMASIRANFIPSGVEGWIVVSVSAVLGVLALPLLPQARLARLSVSNRAWLRFYIWLFAAFLWSPFVGSVVPVGSTFVYASPAEQVLTVSRKRSPRWRVHCNGLVLKEYEKLFGSTICVSAGLWDSLSPGARIQVRGVANGLGFRVVEVYAR